MGRERSTPGHVPVPPSALKEITFPRDYLLWKGAGMTQDELYLRAAAEFGQALARLARAYEADADQRRDLLQDMHLALWRSFAHFAGQCSLRTWVYRVCHNTAISTTVRRRRKAPLVSLEELAETPSPDDPEIAAGNDRRSRSSSVILRRPVASCSRS